MLKIIQFIGPNILRPVLDRLVSQLGMLLASLGLSAGEISEITAAVIVIGGIVIDLLVRKLP